MRYDRSAIAAYELGNNEPPSIVLLAYARNRGGAPLDVLVDDDLDLPDELPSKKTSLGKKQKAVI